MRTMLRHPLGSRSVRALYSEIDDGNFAPSNIEVELTRQNLVALPWSWLNQVHGDEVHVVEKPADHCGSVGDALVTAVSGAVLCVQTADCAPVVFLSKGGAVGVAHAGWKGLEAGILQNTVAALRSLVGGEVTAKLGPCIHSCCYEFGAADLERLADVFGPGIQKVDRAGNPSLDLPKAVRSALESVDVELAESSDRCTEQESFWSHRLRRQSQRMTTCIWIEP